MTAEPIRNVIAIVGRPNVGKSSLFNRILGRRVAIVEKHSGTTRDRLGQKTNWNGVPFELLDTGGIITDPEEELQKTVTLQVEVAISEASVILFVVDVSAGMTPLDMEIADMLRQASSHGWVGLSRKRRSLTNRGLNAGPRGGGHKKIIVVVNKCDSHARLQSAPEFYALGFEKVFGVSAIHGLGVGELLDEGVSGLPKDVPEEAEAALRIAVVGQPNVGKSTFINFLLGEERLVVHDAPGTTRDSIDVLYKTEDGNRILFIDTAGIRRRRSMSRPIEKLSSLRAERSVGKCDVAILMLDAATGPTTGDARIAHIIQEKQKSCVLAVNKWDLIEGVSQDAFAVAVYERLPFLKYCPLVFTIATTGQGVRRGLRIATEVHWESIKRIPTPTLNEIVQGAIAHRSPPLAKTAGRARRLKIYYAAQTGVSPPRIRLFVNKKYLVNPNYLSYLTNRIRASFPFPGSPIVLELRDRV